MRRKGSLRCRKACASRKGSPPILKLKRFTLPPSTSALTLTNFYGLLNTASSSPSETLAGRLLGLQFHRLDDKVYIVNFGASKIQRIAANFTDTTEIEDVASIPPIGPPP